MVLSAVFFLVALILYGVIAFGGSSERINLYAVADFFFALGVAFAFRVFPI